MNNEIEIYKMSTIQGTIEHVILCYFKIIGQMCIRHILYMIGKKRTCV